MKQIAVVMSLVLYVFVLSGCNGTGDDKNADKEECDKKGADWIWDVRNTECVVKATTKEDCEAKGVGWLWDEANQRCNQNTAGLGDKEKCEAKGAVWTWDETNQQCNSAYMSITVPDAAAVTIVDSNGVEKELRAFVGFTATSSRYSFSSAIYGEHRINPGECIKVHKSHVPKISVELTGSNYLDVLCSPVPGYTDVLPCVVGNYGFVKEKSRSDMLLLELLSGVDVDSCRELSPPESGDQILISRPSE